MIGIFAIDPGGHTGVAFGAFDEKSESLYDALADKRDANSVTYEGDPGRQARQIASLWRTFYRVCVEVHEIDPSRVYFVCEDFQLGPNTPPGSDILLACKVAWATWGYRLGRADEFEARDWWPLGPLATHWQLSSQAMNFASDARLKRWGLWVKGKDHERAAWRHLAYFLNGFIK